MGLGTQLASLNGLPVTMIVARDASGSLVASLVLLDSSGQELGTSSNPLNVALPQATSIATGQANVGVSPSLIVAARPGRRAVSITQEGTVLVRLGPSGVSMASGAVLPGVQYADRVIGGGAAIYGIVASGSTVVSYMEEF